MAPHQVRAYFQPTLAIEPPQQSTNGSEASSPLTEVDLCASSRWHSHAIINERAPRARTPTAVGRFTAMRAGGGGGGPPDHPGVGFPTTSSKALSSGSLFHLGPMWSIVSLHVLVIWVTRRVLRFLGFQLNGTDPEQRQIRQRRRAQLSTA